MKVGLNFKKSVMLAGILLLLFGASLAQEQTTIKLTIHDNTEQNYAIEHTGKLWFDNNNLIINVDNSKAPISIPLSSIRKITFDGNGNTIGVNEVDTNKETILIFPNPAISYFDLKTSGTEKLNVRIFNTNGLLVENGTYMDGSRVDISHLTAGIYVIVVNNQSFRLIKQ